jgi:hypothetical protein
MSPCRYRNDINKTIHFMRKIAKMSEENYNVSVPCTHLELKKYYKLCSVAFET